MWYSVEDNPEITAALEEERASSLSRKNSPRAKRGEAFFQSEDDVSVRFQSPMFVPRTCHPIDRSQLGLFAARTKL